MSSGILGPPNADVATRLATPNCCSQKRPCLVSEIFSIKVADRQTDTETRRLIIRVARLQLAVAGGEPKNKYNGYRLFFAAVDISAMCCRSISVIFAFFSVSLTVVMSYVFRAPQRIALCYREPSVCLSVCLSVKTGLS